MSRFPKSAFGLCIFGFVLLTGCGTLEYQAERKHCEAEWMLKIPPVYRQEAVTKYRSETRLTGKMTCTTEDSITNCTQDTETISVPYMAIETVDIKKQLRNPQIASCAARVCSAKYGNSKCEM
ncbi:MAG: hypothetical protein ACTJG4_11690 [Vreelandella alkaliphila]|uniref:Lipoprotein n=1 Tax=Halomonas campaniensis TaxID=213554 RepID=A0A3D0KK66_9GAMM|nr:MULTISPECIES: hypothetical protein [unclassified Halomonas]HBP41446.1 hypothetical protein [Halomonas sp.]HBS83223.1 hypothetical protein [Halomonas campaniensis]HCA03755.1 hypothetical protein [Halomonas campaniensis]